MGLKDKNNMENLKFRVWDTLEERFITHDKGYQGHYVLSLNGKFNNLQNGSGGKECIVQQYTSLQDKNGKEIYEGDILHVGNASGWNSLVYFENGSFRLNTWELYLFIKDGTLIEIIGNIFENPELLEK